MGRGVERAPRRQGDPDHSHGSIPRMARWLKGSVRTMGSHPSVACTGQREPARSRSGSANARPRRCVVLPRCVSRLAATGLPRPELGANGTVHTWWLHPRGQTAETVACTDFEARQNSNPARLRFNQNHYSKAGHTSYLTEQSQLLDDDRRGR
jgi:hypothetical protein